MFVDMRAVGAPVERCGDDSLGPFSILSVDDSRHLEHRQVAFVLGLLAERWEDVAHAGLLTRFAAFVHEVGLPHGDFPLGF